MKKTTLAVLGCGNMAQAIIKALCKKETCRALRAQKISLQITVSDPDADKTAQLDAPVDKTTDNAAAIRSAQYVLLAVKPQSAPDMLRTLDLRDKTVISIMAGTSLSALQQLTAAQKIVRVMPNLNARVCKSYNAYAHIGLAQNELRFVHALLSSFGSAAMVEESQLDEITGLTGSSPAFVFMMLKALIDKGIECGFTDTEAQNMAIATVLGSATLLQAQSQPDLTALIDSVCSKGGTTIEGVRYLQAQQFENTVKTAVEKAILRAKELSETK